jgi:RHS repeat-associated protein
MCIPSFLFETANLAPKVMKANGWRQPERYDAEGNLNGVDGGQTASYIYDGLNRRTQTTEGGNLVEYFYDLNGRRISTWNGTTNAQIEGQSYWGSMPVEFYSGGSSHFQHQDWEGTERLRTAYNGAVEGTYQSLPFGDGFTASGSDNDAYHFAMLDHDYASYTDHAQFRQYENIQGRWMSPDPYGGSYDPANPQSLNRYSYVGNNPLAFVDPSGAILQTVCDANNNCTTFDDGTGIAGTGDTGFNCGDGCAGVTAGQSPTIDTGTQSLGTLLPTDGGGTDFGGGFNGGIVALGAIGGTGSGSASNNVPDTKSCASRLAAGVQQNTGMTPTNLQYTGTVGGHANYTFDVFDPSGFQNILNNNPPFSLPFGIDQGYRYGVIQSTHIENTLTGGFSGHTDLFSGHSILAPLHLLVDVGIGHIPGVNLDFGCKAGS